MSLRLAIAGAAGRMGRALVSAALADGLQIAGGTERPGHTGTDLGRLAGGETLGVVTCADAAEAAQAADVWIDFSVPAATLDALRALVATPVRGVIIGTTGFTPEEEAILHAFGERFAIVKAGNFSLGVHMLAGLVRLAAGRLGAGEWDIEITETHHRLKVDAPSGTALMLGEAAAGARGQSLDAARRAPDELVAGPRPEGSIGFAVRRGGGVFGEHEVMFAASREVIRLSHTAMDRQVFAEGAIAAARWVASQPPGFYGMADMLGL
jgi:4-hydroxy-tetrahydrodipicolinate reductase